MRRMISGSKMLLAALLCASGVAFAKEFYKPGKVVGWAFYKE